MDTIVRHAPERSRYEIVIDGDIVGIADYSITGDTVVFPHTVIDPARRGEGLGEQLVSAALDDVRRTGMRIRPVCWYVAQFVEEHPDYADLVAA